RAVRRVEHDQRPVVRAAEDAARASDCVGIPLDGKLDAAQKPEPASVGKSLVAVARVVDRSVEAYGVAGGRIGSAQVAARDGRADGWAVEDEGVVLHGGLRIAVVR